MKRVFRGFEEDGKYFYHHVINNVLDGNRPACAGYFKNPCEYKVTVIVEKIKKRKKKVKPEHYVGVLALDHYMRTGKLVKR